VYLPVVLVSLRSSVEALSAQMTLELLLCQDAIECILLILNSSGGVIVPIGYSLGPPHEEVVMSRDAQNDN